MRVGGGRWAGGQACQCAGQVCRTRQVLWVSECRTSVVGVSVQDMYVGVRVQDIFCGCQCAGQVCWCQSAGQVLWVSVYRTSVCGCWSAGQVLWVSVYKTSVVGVSVHAGHLLWVSVCSPAWLFAEQNRVCRMHVLLLAGRCEPIWAHGALQDQELNQEPSSCLLFVLVGTFFSLSFLGILG